MLLSLRAIIIMEPAQLIEFHHSASDLLWLRCFGFHRQRGNPGTVHQNLDAEAVGEGTQLHLPPPLLAVAHALAVATPLHT